MSKKKQSYESKGAKLRVGVIGVGYLGKFHAQKYAHMPNIELVGVVDTNPTQANDIAQQLNTRAFYDYRELMGKVDAVSIAVPTPFHYAISRDFLINSVDVLIEKPITTRIEEADDLIQLAENHGSIIQVGHLERFNPAVIALDGIIQSPRFIESHRLSLFKGRGTDVSVVLDLMIHDIDIILNFVPSKVKEIHAAGVSVISPHVDIANARLEFDNGCVANVTASRISTKNERKIRLFQNEAYISVDFGTHEISIVSPNDESHDGIIPGMSIQQLCFSKSDALDEELKAFIQSVATRNVPEVTGQMGRNALDIALNIMEQISKANSRIAR